MEFCHSYYEDRDRRMALHALARRVFDLDLDTPTPFEHHASEYRPFSFFVGNRAIANVSASVRVIECAFTPDVLGVPPTATEPLETGLYVRGDLALPHEPFRFPLTAQA